MRQQAHLATVRDCTDGVYICCALRRRQVTAHLLLLPLVPRAFPVVSWVRRLRHARHAPRLHTRLLPSWVTRLGVMCCLSEYLRLFRKLTMTGKVTTFFGQSLGQRCDGCAHTGPQSDPMGPRWNRRQMSQLLGAAIWNLQPLWLLTKTAMYWKCAWKGVSVSTVTI